MEVEKGSRQPHLVCTPHCGVLLFLVSGVKGVGVLFLLRHHEGSPTWRSLKFRGIESKLIQPSDKLILEIMYGGVIVFGN